LSGWTFRPLARADYLLVAHWLRQPHVARWWADDASPQGFEADYGGVIDGTEPCDVFIALRDGAAFGLIQRLRWHAYPDYVREAQALLPIPPGAWSIDYLVGELHHTGQGWGSAMVGAFVQRLWADHPEVSCIVVPVHVENRASWRALERQGFVRVAHGELSPDNPADSREHVVLRLDRPAPA
jgi:aminoglycoside 6'-N-acetyltransferase